MTRATSMAGKPRDFRRRLLLGTAVCLGLVVTVDRVQALTPAEIAPIAQTTLEIATSESGTGMGVSAGIRYADGTVWTGAAGWADAAKTRAMQASDQFRVGSITKTFTATAVLEMVDQGLISLDATVSSLLPSLTINNGDKITVRQLLQMRSGLPEYLTLDAPNAPGQTIGEEWLDKEGKVYYSPTTLVNLAGSAASLFEPGTKMSYSNTNYVLLGMIAEQASCNQATGCQTIGKIINSQVVARVPGMTNTFYPNTNEYTGSYVEGLGLLSDGVTMGNFVDADLTVPGAAGAMVSNIADELLWARQLGTNYAGLLTAATQAARTVAPADGVIASVIPVTYGEGILTGVTPGTANTMIGHGGTLNGGTAQVYWLPELSMAYAVNFSQFPVSWPTNLPYQYMGLQDLVPVTDENNYGSQFVYYMLQRNVTLALSADGDCMTGTKTAVSGAASCTGDSIRTDGIALGSGASVTVAASGRTMTSAYLVDENYNTNLVLYTTNRPTLSVYGHNMAAITAQGGGVVTISAGGILDMTGNNSVAVKLTGVGNTLTVAGAAGAYGNNALVVSTSGSSNTVTVASTGTIYGDMSIGGQGDVTRVDGTVTGSIALSGANEVLRIDGTVKGTVTSSSSTARIQGSGLIYTLTGGYVAPGNSIGTMTVGSYRASGGTLEIETGANGTADRMDVLGTARLAGGTLKVLTEKGSPDGVFTIISANRVTGAFDAVTSDSRVAVVPDIGATTVRLAQVNPVLLDAGLRSGGQSVIRQLDLAERHLLTLRGETGAGGGVQTAALSSSGSMSDVSTGGGYAELVQALSAAPIDAKGRDGLNVWAQGYYQTGRFNQDKGVPSFDNDGGGLVAGIDGKVTDTFTVGALFGYQRSRTDAATGGFKLETDAYYGGIYGLVDLPEITINASVVAGWANNDTKRPVNVLGVRNTAGGDYGDVRLSGRLAVSKNVPIANGLSIEPRAALSYLQLETDAYTETGAGDGNLRVGRVSTSQLRAEATVALRGSTKTAGGVLSGELSAGVARDYFGGGRDATVSVLNSRVSVKARSDDALVVPVGARIAWKSAGGFDVFASYDGEVSSQFTDHRFSGGLRVSF